MAVWLENAAFTAAILGILVKWPLDLKMELAQLEPLEFESHGRLLENGVFTAGTLGILGNWPFDLKLELSQLELLEF